MISFGRFLASPTDKRQWKSFRLAYYFRGISWDIGVHKQLQNLVQHLILQFFSSSHLMKILLLSWQYLARRWTYKFLVNLPRYNMDGWSARIKNRLHFFLQQKACSSVAFKTRCPSPSPSPFSKEWTESIFVSWTQNAEQLRMPHISLWQRHWRNATQHEDTPSLPLYIATPGWRFRWKIMTSLPVSGKLRFHSVVTIPIQEQPQPLEWGPKTESWFSQRKEKEISPLCWNYITTKGLKQMRT